jgi:transposase
MTEHSPHGRSNQPSPGPRLRRRPGQRRHLRQRARHPPQRRQYPRCPARGQGPAASDTLLVCEATGGHEASLLGIAWQAGLTAHRADPRKAHNFLLSLRNAGKSDSIDAQGLARYGLERGDRLPRWQPPEPCRQALQGLVRLRADLVDDRADYSRRLKAPGQGIDKRHIQAVVDALSQHIAALEADIDRLIAHNADLADSVAVIQAIPGCGLRTATTLLALMPELGHLNRRQAAALAGVAPHPNDTGKSTGYRRVRGGRPAIKAALFTAALAASRFHPQLGPHYQALLAKGKKRIVAIIAIARRLITIINAKLRDNSSKPQQLC